MKKFSKLLAPLVGGVILMVLLLSNGVLVNATPPLPTPSGPTECTACQSHQDDLDAAYASLNEVHTEIVALSLQAEGIINNYCITVGNHAFLDNLVAGGHLTSGAGCEDPTNTYAYYSSFSHADSPDLYCFGNEAQASTFYDNLASDPDVGPLAIADETEWLDLLDWLMGFLSDADTDPDDLEDIFDLIDAILALLIDCENTNCVECPDCEAIAADLTEALDDLEDLEDMADQLDAELTELEEDIEEVFDQLDQWDQIREAFEQMVEDAGGMHGSDCDNFQVGSGQAWGIAHTFGDVQFCFTNEGQIEDMIQNLKDYWENNSHQHLPSEQELNDQLDQLMNDYMDKLDEYDDVLDLIDQVNDQIDDLVTELDACLDELAALQAQGFCLDQDIAAMEDVIDRALGIEPYEPTPPAPEGEPEDPFDDDDGHWAEDFINDLAGGDVVSGDEGTTNFRPNDPVNRGEATKMGLLANDDLPAETYVDSFFDVLIEDWFWSYVLAALDLEYVEGYEDGSFGPARSILRGEAAALVARITGFILIEFDTYSFPDITGEEWFADYAEMMYRCGIMIGRLVDGERLFEGGEEITRAEFAKIVALSIFIDFLQSSCDLGDFEPECPDCDAIWAEAEALGAELDALSDAWDAIEDQLEELEQLREEFRQMVEDAGGMTDADCDGFEVGSGQAWGIAHNFGDVQWCFTSQSQIQDMIENLEEYWQNNSSSHLPSEQTLQDQLNDAMNAYTDKLGEYIEKLGEYTECMEELAALQALGYCLD